jgi:hypothetical protein
MSKICLPFLGKFILIRLQLPRPSGTPLLRQAQHDASQEGESKFPSFQRGVARRRRDGVFKCYIQSFIESNFLIIC